MGFCGPCRNSVTGLVAVMVVLGMAAGPRGFVMAQRVILHETFDDDTPDMLPNTVDNYARSSTNPDPLLDPSTAVVTGGTFPDPFGIAGNQSLVLHNPESTTQMAVTWTDEFDDDPSTFRNGTIEFDIYLASPDPLAYWTFLATRIGHGGPDRAGVTTVNGSDVTVWGSYRVLRAAPEDETFIEQLTDDGGRFLAGAPYTYSDTEEDDLFGPDRAFHVKYELDGIGSTFDDPPTYTLTVSDMPVEWSDGESEHFWIINSGTFAFAPGVNILSFLTDASARSLLEQGYSPGIGNAYIDNLVVINNDLSPLGNGDYNGDGVVNAADYTVWRDTLGDSVPAGTGADGDGNGMIQQEDYVVWKQKFGTSVGSSNGLAAIPEPGALMLVLISWLSLFVIRGRYSFQPQISSSRHS